MLKVNGRVMLESEVCAEIVQSLRLGYPTEELGKQIMAVGEWTIGLLRGEIAPSEVPEVLSRYIDRALKVWPKLEHGRPISCLSNQVRWAWSDHQKKEAQRKRLHRAWAQENYDADQ